MPKRPHKFVWLLLALLLGAQTLVPAAASAEAQMRCMDAAASSRPCARVPLPASGLTPQKAYTALMACCRMAKSGCAMRQGCPATHGPQTVGTSPRRAVLSMSRCLVTIRVVPLSRVSVAPRRAKWLLAAAPALAPPAVPAPSDRFAVVTEPHPSPLASAHPLRHLPCLNGLRAPPAS